MDRNHDWRLEALHFETIKELRIDVMLVQLNPEWSRKQVKKLIDLGRVSLDGKRVRIAKTPVKEGMQIEVGAAAATATMDPSRILYDDACLLIVDKPAGIAVHHDYGRVGKGDFLEVVRQYARERKLFFDGDYLEPLHRLDKDTSGILVLYKDKAVAGPLQTQWKSGDVKKTYHAIAHGCLATRSKFTHEGSVNGKASSTEFEVVRLLRKNLQLVKAILHSGRKHQIRIHLAALSCPVVGDHRYGSETKLDREVAHQLLHASHLSFRHPETNIPIEVEAPFPESFKTYMQGSSSGRSTSRSVRSSTTRSRPQRTGSGAKKTTTKAAVGKTAAGRGFRRKNEKRSK